MDHLEQLLRAHVQGCPHCAHEVKTCGAGHLCRRSVGNASPVAQSRHMGEVLASTREALPGFGDHGGGHTPPARTQGAAPARYEELISGSHTPAEPTTRIVLLEDDIILCRSCAKFCHRCCFEVVEEQCARCVALRPDAARTPKMTSHMSADGPMLTADPADIFLWDTCQEHWF
eukprot:CAMPEP_0206289860 /NCGR_PEP_ID=MMETSP0106_2-20121207/2328_1 /ASSEMBLY_ACC=CAM_ASM_000206 /TAXON_ID=81532 /ORGANISM="Acanthoeca-like sp., Strain 10tr" /LENGTH=173 /DNA_ID=CAMNT_0053720415 /DNA_START=394 /DNA_END=915 /DNA_ORIENTATION=+